MAKSVLPAAWNVPQVFRDRLGDRAGRQRPMVAEDHLLLVLHAPPKPEENSRVGRFFWRDPTGEWRSAEHGSGLHSLQKHIDEYQDIIEKLEEQEDAASTAEDYFSVVEQLSPVFRSARNMHQVLQEARKACPAYRELINLRDRAYDTQRTAELLYEGAKNGLDFAVAQRAEEQAQASHRMSVSAHRLNLLASFFFPIATLSAIFGVNLQHGWEDVPAPVPFLVVIGLGLVLGAILTSFVTKKPT